MGAGKSTVGRMLGRKLNRRFIDSDHALEERCGVKIPTIFEMEGEVGFRKRESQIIEELTQEKDVILATGGGFAAKWRSQDYLRKSLCASRPPLSRNR
jgi:shikimate kinase